MLTADIPDTRRSCGCRRPALGRGSCVAAPRARPPVRRNTRGLDRSRGRSRADSSIRGRTAVDDRDRLGVAHLATPAATGRPPPPSSPRPSRCCRSRRRCADRAARRRSRASGRRRAAGARKRSESNSARQHVRPERRQPLVKARPALGHQLEHRPVELHHLVAAAAAAPATPAAASAASDRPARRRPRSPVIRRCEWITDRPRSAMNRCLPWVRTSVTARPSSRSGQRSEAWRGCGVRITSGTVPSSTGRIRAARRSAIVSSLAASGCAQALRVSRRGPSWNPSAVSAGASGELIAGSPSTFSSARRLIAPRADVLDQRRQRRLEPRIAAARRASAAPGRRARGRAPASPPTSTT